MDYLAVIRHWSWMMHCSMIFVRLFAQPLCLPMMNIHSIINMLRDHSDIAYVAEELLNIFMNAIVHVEFASIAQRNVGTMIVHSTKHDVLKC